MNGSTQIPYILFCVSFLLFTEANTAAALFDDDCGIVVENSYGKTMTVTVFNGDDDIGRFPAVDENITAGSSSNFSCVHKSQCKIKWHEADKLYRILDLSGIPVNCDSRYVIASSYGG